MAFVRGEPDRAGGVLREGGHEPWPLFVGVAVTFSVALLLGGAGTDFPLLGAIVELSALGLLWYTLILLVRGKARSRLPYIAALAVVALPALQLLPVPFELWRALPGRELPSQILAITGETTAWRSISLSPERTTTTAIELLPGLALLLSVGHLSKRQNLQLVYIVLAAAILTFVIGLMQRSSGGTAANLFASSHAPAAPGLFVNRNHQATFLLVAMLLSAGAFALRSRHQILSAALAGAFMLLMATGVVVTKSRAGLLLLPVAGVASLLILLPLRWNLKRICVAGAILVVVLAIVAQTSAVQATLARFAQDPEQRTAYWSDTSSAIRTYWPVGSGLGTFEPVYQTVASLDVVGTHTVNNAHNDYVELMLEGGLPAVVQFLLFLGFMAATAVRLWRLAQRGSDIALGASSWIAIMIIMLHSVLDYPLRMLSIMAVFGFLCGILINSLGEEEQGARERNLRLSPKDQRTVTASHLLSVRFVTAAVITIVTLLLAGMVAASSLSTRHFLRGDYEQAARLNPASADTAVEVAGEALDEGNLPQADRFSRMAIRSLPLNSNALAILALARRQSGGMAQAERLMSAAARMGWENIDVQVWALDKALRNDDATEMILRADALLEQEFDSPLVFSTIRYASTKPEGFNRLVARLVARPKWRRTYLVALAGISPADYAIHRKLLDALERSSAPPSEEERDAFDRAVAALPARAASVVR